ncbi:penicillin-binding transpeptidase domain-containing protein [Streptoalloteichus tenebrarius]|uniref:penicillin-binding transpeptidase domain-containing protein n=1 Tax=Streptoalloteichus tenebrarius (strain ATCC 17920 / DSM 40477 / JCM 4838 / CBS 697.72 / NBRC 16177 / NCIMB 11028 / NRRL B-12390 / A12253. 1 / ISP 5477) TaxID=1933 RepID=UPI0020A4EE5F|nr:penicillin-binding transpeptidase domain-containing protein [Streptoalloteichus tenebrarius]BFE99898.1 penicillin-binding transpeptidase domain-containing protein [Streptoalloteichus tenebrarius]
MGVVVAGISVLWPSDKKGPPPSAAATSTAEQGVTAESAARQFLTAFANGDARTAASLTDAPDTAEAALRDTREALRPASVLTSVTSVSVKDAAASATAGYSVTWQLGGERTWAYEGSMEVVRTDRWRVRWAPGVVHPKLAANQKLALRVDQIGPAVVDPAGQPLLAWDVGVAVLLDRRQATNLDDVVTKLSTAISPVDAKVTKQSIVDGLATVMSGQPYEVATLPEAEYQRIKPQIYNLPGVSFQSRSALRGVDPELRSYLMGSMHKALEGKDAGSRGWRVVAVDDASGGETVLHQQEGKATTPITATLRSEIQKAAQRALAAQPKAAALVAIAPSSGEILAAAQNAAADQLGDVALQKRVPPGSTFKMVTASAVLQNGLATPDTPLPCPGTTRVGARTLPNENRFDLGTVPLRTAFAASCNTTFAELAAKLPADALPTAAAQLGLVADYDVPGITTLAGSVPTSPEDAQRVEDAIGQGRVETSPFGMAVAAATVAAGRNVSPVLLRGRRTSVSGAIAPPPATALPALRGMMREVVTSGTAKELAGIAGLHGKTGTAEYQDDGRSHGWFVGFRGDVAFAVLVMDGGSSKPAVRIAGDFLNAVG